MNIWLSLHPAFPEMLFVAGIAVILLIDVSVAREKKALTFYLSELLLISLGVVLIKEWDAPKQVLFSGHYIIDAFAVGFKALLVLMTFLIFVYAQAQKKLQAYLSDFYLLGLFALLGAMVLISGASLISLYLGLELLSLPVYALVALQRDSGHAAEAAMKYFIMGALASALLLFGFSLIYGLTGTIYLTGISSQVALVSNSPIFLVALGFIVVAIAFKLGIVPFHMWVPDVYQGAPLAVLALLTSIPKFAAFALLIRLLVDGFGSMFLDAQQLLFALGAVSLIFGNLAALVQKNLKRLLAYSTIANMGLIFIVLGLASPEAEASAAFYLISYSFMTLAVLGLLMWVLPEVQAVDELKGLSSRHPFIALLLLLSLLSFAGIPPLLGFDAKLLALMALIHQGHMLLALLIVLMSVVAAAYYLRIVKSLYFDKVELVTNFNGLNKNQLWVSINALALLGFGLFPSSLMILVQQLFSA